LPEDVRARFAPVAYAPPVEPVDARYPLALTTGRLRDQWHGMSRTGTVGRLGGHAAGPCVQLHPGELQRRALGEGDLVRVRSRRGTLVLPAQASEEVRAGQAFIAMHWGEEVLGGADERGRRFGVNHLTLDAVDEVSGQPELKHTAVAVEPARLDWHYCVFGRVGAARWLALQRSLRQHFAAFGYCACVPLWSGHDDDGALLLRAAAATPPDPARLEAIEAEFGLAEADTLRYDDRQRFARRRIRTRGTVLMAAALGGEAAALAAEPWLRELFVSGLPAGVAPIQLMSSTRPAAAARARGRVVCSCLDVGEQQIRQLLAGYAGADPVGALGEALKCGTECGSCRPELTRIADEVRSNRREDLRLLSSPLSHAVGEGRG